MKYLFMCMLMMHVSLFASSDKPEPREQGAVPRAVRADNDSDSLLNLVQRLGTPNSGPESDRLHDALEGLMVVQAYLNNGILAPAFPNTPN